MKTKLLQLSIALATAFMFAACEKPQTPDSNPTNNDSINNYNDTIILGTGHGAEGVTINGDNFEGMEGTMGPLSVLTIVKFYNPGQENKVILQHPIKQYHDGYEYYDKTDLYFNIQLQPSEQGSNAGVNPSLIEWAEQEMHIAGTSPYIPLIDGYYLIDWKWHQLLPLSSLANEAWPNAYHNYFAEHILNHAFMTDMEWTDVKDLTKGYSDSLNTQPVKGIELIRVWPKALASMYNDVDSDTYLCWNMSIYYCDGMCFDNAYAYYKYGDCTNSGKTYHTYLAYCDSLQSVYQQRLKELINNGKLKDIGF